MCIGINGVRRMTEAGYSLRDCFRGGPSEVQELSNEDRPTGHSFAWESSATIQSVTPNPRGPGPRILARSFFDIPSLHLGGVREITYGVRFKGLKLNLITPTSKKYGAHVESPNWRRLCPAFVELDGGLAEPGLYGSLDPVPDPEGADGDDGEEVMDADGVDVEETKLPANSPPRLAAGVIHAHLDDNLLARFRKPPHDKSVIGWKYPSSNARYRAAEISLKEDIAPSGGCDANGAVSRVGHAAHRGECGSIALEGWRGCAVEDSTVHPNMIEGRRRLSGHKLQRYIVEQWRKDDNECKATELRRERIMARFSLPNPCKTRREDRAGYHRRDGDRGNGVVSLRVNTIGEEGKEKE
ncbi:hypothetical protein FB451DRAFT_1377658 [Mycena latifolia]|nr:hypothetical protein FB451DRAFT_1377658 [Mycena latifolia]